MSCPGILLGDFGVRVKRRRGVREFLEYFGITFIVLLRQVRFTPIPSQPGEIANKDISNEFAILSEYLRCSLETSSVYFNFNLRRRDRERQVVDGFGSS